jgi:lantibiotic biosynthesis protein
VTWRPLIEDAPRRAVIRGVLDDIAAAVAAHEPDPRDLDTLTDQAILRTYLAADETVLDPRDAAVGALGAAVTRFGSGGFGPTLYGGMSRVAWTVAHVAGGDDAEQACSLFDATLARVLDDWRGDYDLILGLVGFGIYALERGDAGAPLARRVLDALERRALPRGAGHAWLTGPELLHPDHRETAPDGYWNLGLAHGIPGVIGLLARFVRAGIEPLRSRALLDGAVAFLLGAIPEGGPYPAWQPSTVPASPRLAWCYGDLGVAHALLGAALYADRPAWSTAALAIAHGCATRSYADARISDAAICHGAGGVAHLFNRMAVATGDAVLADAARTWIDRALALRCGEPLAGFPRREQNTPPEADASLLTGASGVGLVLHAAISELEPGWDRLLMADLPQN